MTRVYEHIDQYLDEQDVLVVPKSFVASAIIVYEHGKTRNVSVDEATALVEGDMLEELGIVQITAVIDMGLVRETVVDLCDHLYSFMD